MTVAVLAAAVLWLRSGAGWPASGAHAGSRQHGDFHVPPMARPLGRLTDEAEGIRSRGPRSAARWRRAPGKWRPDQIRDLERAFQSPGCGEHRVALIAAHIAAWARADPKAAWAWVTAHYPSAPGKTGTLPVLPLLQALAARDPRLVVAYAGAVRDGTSQPEGVHVCSAALAALVTTGHVELARGVVEQWLAAPGPRTVDAAAISLVAVALADHSSPPSAAAWLGRMGSVADCGEAVGMLASSWAESNPGAALGWAQSLGTPAQRTAATERAFAVWSDHDPDGASRWFLAHEANDGSDQLIPIFLQHSQLPYTSPAAALQWASLARDAATRAQCMALALGEPTGP